jgi:hypothetical protein
MAGSNLKGRTVMNRDQISRRILRGIGVSSLAVLLVYLMRTPALGQTYDTGFEWNHWSIGDALDYSTGKSALASALDLIEGAGWEVRFVTARPGAYGAVYDVVGRGRKGLYIPQAPPVEPQPAPVGQQAPWDYTDSTTTRTATPTAAPPPTETATSTVTCPGTHHACRVLPAGTYQKSSVDVIGR